MDFSLIILLLVLGLGLYPLLLAGWASNRAYAIVGGLRGVAQTISYEVSLALLLICYFALISGLRLSRLRGLRRVISFFLTLSLFRMWLIIGLAETNRTPFDFAEGERELVSGFNIEYGAGGFALIFMAEYGRILLMRVLRGLLLGLGRPVRAVSLLGALGVAYF
jgi:NADH-ubiquinone oxidoreductase chain 1